MKAKALLPSATALLAIGLLGAPPFHEATKRVDLGRLLGGARA